jgi:hypothetical protein
MADNRKPIPTPPRPPEQAPRKQPDYARAITELLLAHTELELKRAKARDDVDAVRLLSRGIARSEEALQ